jgi:beta-N-acetylhexosaminidase
VSDAAADIVLAAIEGAELSPDERAFFEREAPAGVTLFRRNFAQGPAGCRALVRELQSLRRAGAPPVIVAVDQEGGRVSRIAPPFPDRGPAQGLAGGRCDPAALAEIEGYAQTVGSALLDLGINVNFAPVVDVLCEPTNRAIGDRAFGEQPDAVAARAGAFLRGLERSGVLGCPKHFPGQGAARVDTHVGRAVVDVPRARLDERELAPFRALLPDASLVMLSHCVYPDLDRCEASRSRPIIADLLRADLGFDGAALSDDMNMGAVPQDEAAWREALIEAVVAGVDLVLICRHLERARLAVDALRERARRSPAFGRRVEEAASRVRRVQHKLAAATRSQPE